MTRILKAASVGNRQNGRIRLGPLQHLLRAREPDLLGKFQWRAAAFLPELAEQAPRTDVGDALALTEYEASLVSTPNRLRGLHGAATAAKAANQPEKATAYFRKLAEMTKDADVDRIEISQARSSLMQQ